MSPHEHPDLLSREFLLAFAILQKHGGFKNLSEEEYKTVAEAVLQFEQFKDIPVLFSNPSLLSRVIELLSVREFKAGTFIYEDGVHKDMKYFLVEGQAVYTRQNHILCMASQKQILFQKLEEKSQINASEDKKRAFQLIQEIKNHRNKPVKEIHLGQVFGSRKDYNNHLCFKSKRIEADYQKLQENLESLQTLSVQAQSDCMVVCLPQRSYDYVFSAYVQKLSHLISILCSNFRTIHIEDREHVGTEYFLHMCNDGIYQRKEIIIQQGTSTDYLYFVKSGNVQIQKSITELYQYGPNQYLLQKNFFNSKTYDHNAQATEPETRITRISKPFIALLLNIKTLCPIKNIISKNSMIISPNHMSPQTSSTCSSLNKIQSQSSFQPSQQVLLQYAFQNSSQISSSSSSSLQSFQSLRGIHSSILDKPQNIPASLRDIQMPSDIKLKNSSLSSIPNLHHSPVTFGNQEIGELENKQSIQQSMTESVGRKRRETSTFLETEKSSEDEATTFKQFELSHPESVVRIVKGRHTLRRMNTTNYQTQNEPIQPSQKNDAPSSPPSSLSVNSNSIHKPSNIFLSPASNNESAPRIEKRSSTFVHPKIMSFQNILPDSYSNSPVLAPTSTFRSSSMNIAHQNSLGAAPKKMLFTKTENSQILKLSGFKKFHEDQVKEQTAAHILFATQTAKNHHHSTQQCPLLSRRQLQLKALSSSQSSNSFQQMNQTPQEQIKQTPSPPIDPIWKQTHSKQGISALYVFNKH